MLTIYSLARDISCFVAVTSTAEMKKPVTKRSSKTYTFILSSDDCWDTMKAQLLVKIDAAFDPKPQKLEDFNVMFYVPRILAKPGLHLTSNEEFATMLQRVSKAKNDPVVHVTVSQIIRDEDEKENKDNKKSHDKPLLPGTLAKNDNIRLLQEHWKCPKRQVSCLGTYCFIDEDGSHLPLSHGRLECWASSMVRPFLLTLLRSLITTLAQGRGVSNPRHAPHPQVI
jgi:hypothetical protein